MNPQVILKKRYRSFNDALRETFGEKIWRIGVDAGFTCPNIDGTKGSGGCFYCNNEDLIQRKKVQNLSVREQLVSRMEPLKKTRHAKKFLAYFQPYTNTYAPVKQLRKLYEEALTVDDVVGMSVSTRPDCLPDDVIELLAEFSQKTYLWAEVGLQSAHNKTMELTNRLHTVEEFSDSVRRLKEKNLRTCVHIIYGLPGETVEDMRYTMNYVTSLPIDGIKIHNIYVSRHTILEDWYNAGKFTPIEKDVYVNLVCDTLEKLSPDVVIHRLTAEAPPRQHVAPDWCADKLDVLKCIDREMERRGSYQGKNYGGENGTS